MRTKITFISGVVFLGAIASAHATAERSEPRVGSEISKPPVQVRIWFDDDIVPASSRIQVFGPDGEEVDKNDTHLDSKEKRLLIVSLPDHLPGGTYRVRWQVVCLEGHRTHNEFKFVLKP